MVPSGLRGRYQPPPLICSPGRSIRLEAEDSTPESTPTPSSYAGENARISRYDRLPIVICTWGYCCKSLSIIKLLPLSVFDEGKGADSAIFEKCLEVSPREPLRYIPILTHTTRPTLILSMPPAALPGGDSVAPSIKHFRGGINVVKKGLLYTLAPCEHSSNNCLGSLR